MIDPELGEEQWSVLRFTDVGVIRSPGVVRVSGPGLVIGWDIQNASGASGAVTRRINEPLKEFEAEFELSNDQDEYGLSDFDRWDDFESYLREMVASRTKPFARDVYHPDLARVGITSVTLKSIGLLQPDGKGGGKIKVAFIEHRPPKPLRPVASTKTEGDKKIDAANKEIAELQKQWEKPSGGNGVPVSVGNAAGALVPS